VCAAVATILQCQIYDQAVDNTVYGLFDSAARIGAIQVVVSTAVFSNVALAAHDRWLCQPACMYKVKVDVGKRRQWRRRRHRFGIRLMKE